MHHTHMQAGLVQALLCVDQGGRGGAGGVGVTSCGHLFAVTRVQWYPADTGLFATASLDGTVKLWDANEAQVGRWVGSRRVGMWV